MDDEPFQWCMRFKTSNCSISGGRYPSAAILPNSLDRRGCTNGQSRTFDLYLQMRRRLLYYLCIHRKVLVWWYGCFHRWWYPQNTPKWSFLVRKPMVVGYHQFMKPPYVLFTVHVDLCICNIFLFALDTKPMAFHSVSIALSWHQVYSRTVSATGRLAILFFAFVWPDSIDCDDVLGTGEVGLWKHQPTGAVLFWRKMSIPFLC